MFINIFKCYFKSNLYYQNNYNSILNLDNTYKDIQHRIYSSTLTSSQNLLRTATTDWIHPSTTLESLPQLQVLWFDTLVLLQLQRFADDGGMLSSFYGQGVGWLHIDASLLVVVAGIHFSSFATFGRDDILFSLMFDVSWLSSIFESIVLTSSCRLVGSFVCVVCSNFDGSSSSFGELVDGWTSYGIGDHNCSCVDLLDKNVGGSIVSYFVSLHIHASIGFHFGLPQIGFESFLPLFKMNKERELWLDATSSQTKRKRADTTVSIKRMTREWLECGLSPFLSRATMK